MDASSPYSRYNVLKLPDTIQFGNGRQIINSYDAGGHKLTTRYYTPIGTVIVTQGSIHGGYTTANSVLRLDDYCGSCLYENETSASVHPLTKILTLEGYIDMSTSGYPYCYYKQDHLGSDREVTSYAGTTGTVVQQTEYSPSRKENVVSAFNVGTTNGEVTLTQAFGTIDVGLFILNADIGTVNNRTSTVDGGVLPEVVVTGQNNQTNTNTPLLKVNPVVINLPSLNTNK